MIFGLLGSAVSALGAPALGAGISTVGNMLGGGGGIPGMGQGGMPGMPGQGPGQAGQMPFGVPLPGADGKTTLGGMFNQDPEAEKKRLEQQQAMLQQVMAQSQQGAAVGGAAPISGSAPVDIQQVLQAINNRTRLGR